MKSEELSGHIEVLKAWGLLRVLGECEGRRQAIKSWFWVNYVLSGVGLRVGGRLAAFTLRLWDRRMPMSKAVYVLGVEALEEIPGIVAQWEKEFSLKRRFLVAEQKRQDAEEAELERVRLEEKRLKEEAVRAAFEKQYPFRCELCQSPSETKGECYSCEATRRVDSREGTFLESWSNSRVRSCVPWYRKACHGGDTWFGPT